MSDMVSLRGWSTKPNRKTVMHTFGNRAKYKRRFINLSFIPDIFSGILMFFSNIFGRIFDFFVIFPFWKIFRVAFFIFIVACLVRVFITFNWYVKTRKDILQAQIAKDQHDLELKIDQDYTVFDAKIEKLRDDMNDVQAHSVIIRYKAKPAKPRWATNLKTGKRVLIHKK